MARARPRSATCALAALAASAPAFGAQPCTPHWATDFGGGAGLNASSLAIMRSSEGTVFVGGNFTSAGATQASRVARYTSGGWGLAGAGIPFNNHAGGGSHVQSFAEYDDGSGSAVYVGGFFGWGYPLGPSSVSGVARWTGSEWVTVGGGLWLSGCADCNAEVVDLIVHDDGSGPRLFAGGWFDHVGAATGTPAGGIAAWDGTQWSNLGMVNPFGGGILALAAFDGGGGSALYASGYFQWVARLARWDGASWSYVEGSARVAHDMLIHEDQAGEFLYLAEPFSLGGGLSGGRVRRWNGLRWFTVGPDFDRPVYALAVFDDGTGPALHAGGEFQSLNRLARWDGAAWSTVAGGANGIVLALHPADGEQPSLWVGGEFSGVGGSTSSTNIARLIACPACYPDCNTSGSLTIADFACFQNAFAAGTPYADCNASGTFTIADFACFQAGFAAGCP